MTMSIGKNQPLPLSAQNYLQAPKESQAARPAETSSSPASLEIDINAILGSLSKTEPDANTLTGQAKAFCSSCADAAKLTSKSSMVEESLAKLAKQSSSAQNSQASKKPPETTEQRPSTSSTTESSTQQNRNTTTHKNSQAPQSQPQLTAQTEAFQKKATSLNQSQANNSSMTNPSQDAKGHTMAQSPSVPEHSKSPTNLNGSKMQTLLAQARPHIKNMGSLSQLESLLIFARSSSTAFMDTKTQTQVSTQAMNHAASLFSPSKTTPTFVQSIQTQVAQFAQKTQANVMPFLLPVQNFALWSAKGVYHYTNMVLVKSLEVVLGNLLKLGQQLGEKLEKLLKSVLSLMMFVMQAAMMQAENLRLGEQAILIQQRGFWKKFRRYFKKLRRCQTHKNHKIQTPQDIEEIESIDEILELTELAENSEKSPQFDYSSLTSRKIPHLSSLFAKSSKIL